MEALALNPVIGISPLAGVTPNAGPSLENLTFDSTFYGLACLTAIVALYSAFVALRARGRYADQRQCRMAVGTGSAALGFAATVVTTVSLLALFRAGLVGGVLYLQAEFTVVYLGSALIIFGLDRVVFAWQGQPGLTSRLPLRLVLWIAFLVAVGVAAGYLFDPNTYPVTAVGATSHVGQEAVFWLPPFVTLLAGVTGASLSIRARKDGTRTFALWFACFFLSVVLGSLKESNMIPSSGDPFADMLLAFVPFAFGSFCLAMSATRLRSSHPGLLPKA